MRQIGSLADAEQSQLFADYLQTQGILAQAEQDDAEWAIWVRDENDIERAREELTAFLQDPAALRYREVGRKARQLREEQQRQQQAAVRRTIDMRRHWNRPITQRAPLTMILIGLCVFVALMTRFGVQPTVAGRTQYGFVMRTLAFCDLNRFQQSGDGLQEIRRGQLWRLVTPVFLHYGLIHLGFNLFWLYYLGAQIEMRRGIWAMAGMTLVMALVSNLLQYFVGGGPNFLGISGVNYGLLGYIWMQKTFDPSSGFLVSDSTIVILLLFLAFGFVGAFEGVVGRVANWAHVGGLVAGMVMGYAPVLRQRR